MAKLLGQCQWVLTASAECLQLGHVGFTGLWQCAALSLHCVTPLLLAMGPACFSGTSPLVLMSASTIEVEEVKLSLQHSAQKTSAVTAATGDLGPVPRAQETCCKGLTAALFIRGIRAVLLAITFWVFFRHALLVAASEQVSGAAPWRQQGFSHLCLLQTSQQLPPGSPRGNHHCVRAHPASRQCQCPHGMQPAAELQLLLSFQG